MSALMGLRIGFTLLLLLCTLISVRQSYVPRGCLQFVIVVFPDHTHLLFFTFEFFETILTVNNILVARCC